MSRRYYRNGSPATTITGTINGAATSVAVVAVTSWPSTRPYTAVLDYGTASMEVVLVTNVVGTTLTMTRGYDGTTGVSHSSGATIQPMAAAIDYDEANAHINTGTGVHGLAGALVDTTTAQTLSLKTFASPTITGTASAAAITASGAVATGPLTTTGAATISGAATAASVTAAGTVQGATVVATGNATVGGALTVTSVINANGGMQVTNLTSAGIATLATMNATATTATTATVSSAPSGANDVVNKTYADRQTAYAARVYRSTAWSAGAGTTTDVVFNAEDYDTGSNHNTTTGQYTVPVTGVYTVGFTIGAAVAAGVEYVAVLRTSANVDLLAGSRGYAGGAATVRSSGGGEVRLTSGTIVKLSFYNSGASAAGSTGSAEAFLSISFRG